MSRQSEAKSRQGYVDKSESGKCNTCRYFKYTEEKYKVWGIVYTERKNLKCKLGNFSVKDDSFCNKYRLK